ncbi:hypothetical protein [Edaphobacter modestus]|uniref:Uncharacterized protein n=1 Tax=Edaphobacter modestus TaxID=388466 RepID=A0A4Q7XZS0_9BACT|nr:hypothetical protein [Edaphobacter modestus]RZU28935.1 hypothetical protein BDD14_6520 [Edaphobacter modestus]
MPTEWDSAEKKLAFANHLINFIATDFPRQKFTKGFYNRLSCVFGMIAHYNLEGFYQAFFTCTAAKVRFLSCLLNWPNYGDPAYTYSDVEAAVQEKLRELGFYEMYRSRLGRETEQAERAVLAHLQAKYEGYISDTQPPSKIETPSTRRPVVSVATLEPVQADSQFSLFG